MYHVLDRWTTVKPITWTSVRKGERKEKGIELGSPYVINLFWKEQELGYIKSPNFCESTWKGLTPYFHRIIRKSDERHFGKTTHIFRFISENDGNMNCGPGTEIQ